MMTGLFFTRISVVWLILLAATTVSWFIGLGSGFSDQKLNSCAIIVVAFIKVRLVMLEFMELRHAPSGLRWLAEAWLIVVCSALVLIYFLQRQ